MFKSQAGPENPTCIEANTGLAEKDFFVWSHQPHANYIEPPDISHHCRTEQFDRYGLCTLPQDSRLAPIGPTRPPSAVA